MLLYNPVFWGLYNATLCKAKDRTVPSYINRESLNAGLSVLAKAGLAGCRVVITSINYYLPISFFQVDLLMQTGKIQLCQSIPWGKIKKAPENSRAY